MVIIDDRGAGYPNYRHGTAWDGEEQGDGYPLPCFSANAPI